MRVAHTLINIELGRVFRGSFKSWQLEWPRGSFTSNGDGSLLQGKYPSVATLLHGLSNYP